MKLVALALSNVRNVTLEAAFRPTGPTVFTGPGASGKSTVLDALAAMKEAAGAYGAPPRTVDFRVGDGAGSITLDVELDERERASIGRPASALRLAWDLTQRGPQELAPLPLKDTLRRFDPSPQEWKAELFHAERSLCDVPGANVRESSYRLAKHPLKYGWVRRFLVDATTVAATETEARLRSTGIALAGEGNVAQSGFAAAVAALSPRLRFVGCEHRGEWQCWFARPKGPAIELAQLSAGEKAVVLVAAAVEALGLHRSLVLIDHPEKDLHPEDHTHFFDGLCGLISEGQIVATTTSPALLRSVPRERIIVVT